MVKKILLLLLVSTLLGAQEPTQKTYETNCLVCHKQLSFDLGTIFFEYLLKYSDEVSVKSALVDFLENPNSDTSVMTKEYIKSFGLKQKSELSKKVLQEAIDVYWEKYTVFGKLR